MQTPTNTTESAPDALRAAQPAEQPTEHHTEHHTEGASPVYHLAATPTGAPLRPAVPLGQGWPATVSGLPAYYYWKDAIRTGTYAHPAGRYSLSVTRERLDGYARTFATMRSNGVGVPILADHVPSATATLGWIVAVRREGDRLLELHQFLGADARDIGLRNHVSLGIDPDFVDGRGVRYGEAIVHSAVTPVPVVPGQDEFVALSAEEGRRPVVALALVDEPGPAAPPRDLLAAEAGDAATIPPPPPPPVVERRTFASADPVAEPPGSVADDPLALSLLADAATARRDLAVARGGVDPATADALLALLTHGPAPVIGLSRTAGGRPLAVAVFDALAANRPVPLGEVTGPQSPGRLHLLARAVPGSEATADLTDRMIALASGT